MAAISDALGSYLRTEREQQGVALHDMAAATKIQLKFLQALEEDAYEQLPTGPFIVGFLRTYAQHLDLDADDIMTAYHARRHMPPRQEEPQGPNLPRRFLDHRRMRVYLGAGLLGLGCLVLLLGRSSKTAPQVMLDTAAVTATYPGEPVTSVPVRAPQPPAAAVPSSPFNVPVVLPAQPADPVPPASTPPHIQEAHTAAEDASQVTADAAGAPKPPAAALAEETPLVLQVTALADTWLEVQIDRGVRHKVLLKSGRSARWEAVERFGLTVGNIQGTYVLLNGQEIPLPAGRGNVLRDFLLTDRLLN